MNDSNRMMKWVFVVGFVALALGVLYPPSEKLKGGIDLVGGTSLLFEIDTTGLDASQQRGLSARVMAILRERVDPKGQLNLEWRPVGNSRLEVRMPRPPRAALERRETYNEALQRVEAKNITRFDVESALNAPDNQRDKMLRQLVRGVPARDSLLQAVGEAFGQSHAVDAAPSGAKSYDEAVAELLATSLPVNRLTDVLALPKGERRQKELTALQEQFPAYDAGSESDPDGKVFSKAVAAYDAWAKYKADLEDPSDLKRRLRGAGVLEFRILADRDPSNPTKTIAPNRPDLAQEVSRYTEQLTQYGPRPRAGDRYGWFPVADVLNFLYLDKLEQLEKDPDNPARPIVAEYAGRYYVLAHNDPEYCLLRGTGRRSWALRSASTSVDPMTGRNIVLFSLDPRGGAMFGELTGNNIERSLCIMLDNTAMSHANIQSRITTSGQITGNFTVEKVQNLVRTLEAGSLPARLKETPLMENTVGPSLGETNRTKGFQAAMWGMIVVVIFMLFYYGIAAGGVADIALTLNLLFVLSIMAFLQATFTLPGIAGLILTVGMAVDANVLIFERTREERDRGIIFKKALNAGYDKALSTIVDANLTTLITCIILGFVGSEEVKGFAITLGIGISTSMFTALFVTRLVFNTLIVKGWLKDFSMRRIIGVPSIDWLALRRVFWPVSVAAVAIGLGLFIETSVARTERMFDIEFLGGTSLQVDLKPGIKINDEEMTAMVTSADPSKESAVRWLREAANELEGAEVDRGEGPDEFTLRSDTLTGDRLVDLLTETLEDRVVRGGMRAEGHTAAFDAKSGALSMASFREAVTDAADRARKAAGRLSTARVQSVGSVDAKGGGGLSYEIVSTETNRRVVQAAILGTMGDKLSVQESIVFETVRDNALTEESYFAIKESDHFLSDVLGGNARYDIRPFRGGAAVWVKIDASEPRLPIEGFEKRLREVGLQPEFEQYHTRESKIIPLDQPGTRPDGVTGHRSFAVIAVDESLRYDEDPLTWADGLAKPLLAQVEAALGQEKSLSKVIQFSAPIAGQTRNRAVFAIVLALLSIVAYLWLRFGTKEYGLAAIVALIHDVGITLGLVAASQYVYATVVGRALLLDGFRIDLPMIAAILTVIGYSLNDTIVVFDRIRENKGRVESLNPNIINNSLNQTLSRTLLTSFTTFVVIAIMYVFGGSGIHGFAYALCLGVIVGTYSSLGIATPLLYRTKVLHAVCVVIVAGGVIGVILAAAPSELTRWILTAMTAVICVVLVVRIQRDTAYLASGHPVGA